MSKFVYEIMNPELFAVSPERPAHTVVKDILRLGISSAPVLDRTGYPIGVLSLRDLFDDIGDKTVEACMTSPAVVVEAGITLEAGARLMCASGLRHVVVVDDLGKAVGILSAVDVVRAAFDLPCKHPWPFPYQQGDGSLEWTADSPLESDRIQALAPEGPGVFVLLRQLGDAPDTVVWAEACEAVGARLKAILTSPQADPIARLLERGSLRFRAVATHHRAEREHALRSRGVDSESSENG